MSQLPSAHAGQAFGSRRIDFFTVSGEISSSDASIGRVTDTDGIQHDIRLLERSSALAQGDTATVLRVQSGPNRRSRPVAIVNHSRGLWMRAAPDATTMLSRSGVTRAFNWWLSVLVLALLAVAVSWPTLHAFLTELSGPMMASVPEFNLYDELTALMPGLTSWRLETALWPGVFDAIAALGVVPMEHLTEWGLSIGVALTTLLAFFARSWRLIYVPALAVMCVLAGAVLGGPVISLWMILGAVSVFVLGGLINRIRDAGRFNARVERLAEFVVNHAPEESVRTADLPRPVTAQPVAAPAEPMPAAAAVAAIAAGAALAEASESSGEVEGSGAGDGPETDLTAESETRATEPAPSAANGEAAGELEPASQTDAESDSEAETDSAATTETGVTAEVAAEPELPAESVSDTVTVPEAEAETAADDAEPVAAVTAPEDEAVAEPAVDTAAAETPEALETAEAVAVEADAEPIAMAEPDTAAAEDETAETVESVTVATTDTELDDDLPSLDQVAAAAALNEAEQAGRTEPDVAPAPIPDVDDDRLMAVAAPPPMPQAGESPKAEVVETAERAGIAAIDDPMNEDDHDPMVQHSSGDFAPGVPEIEADRERAE